MLQDLGATTGFFRRVLEDRNAGGGREAGSVRAKGIRRGGTGGV